MDASRASDFSIERILSPQLGSRTAVMEFSPDGSSQEIPAEFDWDSRNLWPRAPVPVPGENCLQHREMSVGEDFYPHGFHHTHFSSMYPNPGVYVHQPAGAQQWPGHSGLHRLVSAQSHLRQKARMRTVFTDGQTKRLESLFEITDYPAAEARAEVARSTGLSEETVRVWFKNRRARRKRGLKVKPSSPPRSAGEENKFFTSFL
ncbi:dharma [Pungitius pungitius]|uniref:dharma n=1 Tax=Pungitius pungitius TaxID=134920 RepID=UPI001886B03E|nr:dharma [Pungitius pungitius]